MALQAKNAQSKPKVKSPNIVRMKKIKYMEKVSFTSTTVFFVPDSEL